MKKMIERSVKVLCLVVIAGLLFPFAGFAQEKAKPIKIGFSMPLTGGMGAAGKSALLAIKICRDDWNRKGGVNGRQVELVYYDDHTKPSDIPGIYTKLITVDKVDFLLGSYGTPLQVAALPVVMENKKIMLGLFAVSANKGINYKYYFNWAPLGEEYGEAWMAFSYGFFKLASTLQPKPKTVALLGVDNESGVKAIDGAVVNAKNNGFEIVYKKSYPPGPDTADFTPTLRAIKATGADLVYIFSFPGETSNIITAAKEIGLKPKMWGGGMVGLQYAAIMKTLGPDMNGIVDYWYLTPQMQLPGIKKFLDQYTPMAIKEGVDELGIYLPPYAYGMLDTLLKSIESTKSLDQATVGDYIRAHGYDTIHGKGTFVPTTGEFQQGAALVVQLQNITSNKIEEFRKPGKMVIVWPDKQKNGNLIYPFPGWK